MIIQSYLQFSAQFHAILLGNFSFKSFIILDYLFGPSWTNFSANRLCLPHSPALFELADPFTKFTYKSPCVQASTNLIALEMRCHCIFYSYLLFLFLGFSASWIAEWFSPQFMHLVALFTYKLFGAFVFIMFKFLTFKTNAVEIYWSTFFIMYPIIIFYKFA